MRLVGIKHIFLLFFAGIACHVTGLYAQQKKLTEYVSPLVGTATSTTPSAHLHGSVSEQLANTIPSVTLPFAMTQWTPQTRLTELKCAVPYYYKDSLLTGFRGSHWLNGGCAHDYGSLTIMPLSGKLQIDPEVFGTVFSHDDEISSPDYYSLLLRRSGIRTEITSTDHCAIFRFTIDHDDSVFLVFRSNNDFGKGYMTIDNKRGQVRICNPVYRIYQFGKPANFNGFFVVNIEGGFKSGGVFGNSRLQPADSISNLTNVGSYIALKLKKGQTVTLRVSGSFTGIEGALKNFSEVNGKSFETIRAEAKNKWEKALGQLEIPGATEKQKRIFYTAFYHAMQLPRLFNDVDGGYPRFAGDHQNEKLETGNYYDDFSMWDIYRAQLPLFEILRPSLVADFVRSMVLKGQQGGWLPNFPLYSFYTGAMVGDHGTAFLSSALMKNIGEADIKEAYRLMRKNAFETPLDSLYKDARGRRALNSYLKYGYYPIEDSIPDAFHKKEQVSRTLEYAYDDYALAMLAGKLGKTDDYKELIRRAEFYKNVYDHTVGFMNARYADGHFYRPFNPDIKPFFITEGTPRQYSFYVPQDVAGLAEIMGGVDSLAKYLDSMFEKSQYWHGNEPDHQVPFMYNYVGQGYKSQFVVSKILNEEYTDGPGGLSGNEDAGQVSAWYIFAMLGIYPVDPVSGEYVLVTPSVDHAIIHLPGNRKFEISVKRSSPGSIYIQSVKLNGSVYTKTFISHTDLVKGGILEIIAGEKPNKQWGKNDTDWPGSISKKTNP